MGSWVGVRLFVKANPPHTVHRKQKANALAGLKKKKEVINKANK